MIKTLLPAVMAVMELCFIKLNREYNGRAHISRRVLLGGLVTLHIVVVFGRLFFPEAAGSAWGEALLYLSLAVGIPGNVFFLVLFIKATHLPVHADRKLTLEEFSKRKEPVRPENNSVTFETEDLFILYPEYRRLRFLNCYENVEQNREYTYACAAAFHKARIPGGLIGPCMKEGVLHESGQRSEGHNLGAFLWDGQRARFCAPEEVEEAFRAAEGNEEACGFSQILLVKDGTPRQIYDVDQMRQCYRVLAEFHGELCIIEGKKRMLFSEYLKEIYAIGPTNVIYLDMGAKMATAWYRDRKGKIRRCFPKFLTRPVNLLLFSKEKKG